MTLCIPATAGIARTTRRTFVKIVEVLFAATFVLARGYDDEYVKERGQYVPALTLTPEERDLDPESAKGKRKGGHPAPERMAKGARCGREDAYEPRVCAGQGALS